MVASTTSGEISLSVLVRPFGVQFLWLSPDFLPCFLDTSSIKRSLVFFSGEQTLDWIATTTTGTEKIVEHETSQACSCVLCG